MARYATYPYLFDEEKSISITDLIKSRFLKEKTNKWGVLTWRYNGQETGAISLKVIMDGYVNHMILKYTCNGNEYNNKVSLTSVPSNLGKGRVWYFICPFTRSRCRKLHLISERFIHRSALPSGMYECQTRSKTFRGWKGVHGSYFEMERYYEEIYSKHFKKYYRGRPTKRYAKLMRKIELSDRYSDVDLEKLII